MSTEETKPTEETKTPNLPFQEWTSSLSKQYQETIKRYGQMSEYLLHIDDKPMTFIRKKLRQWQYDEIEGYRVEATELGIANKLKESKELSDNMYRKAASYILWNKQEQRPMNEEEYRNADFPEIRPALDASLMLALQSPVSPN